MKEKRTLKKHIFPEMEIPTPTLKTPYISETKMKNSKNKRVCSK